MVGSADLGMPHRMQRRSFLTLLTSGAAALPFAGPTSALADLPGNRSLTLYEVHSRATVSVDYMVDGWYHPDALARLDHLMRDWRDQSVLQMDVGLYDILWAVQESCGHSEPIHIVSGYRSPASNAMRASQTRSVARNSYHIYGQAADIRLPGYSLRGLRNNAMALAAGGVGFYPGSDFVHVDTGPVRDW